ncbi:SWI/SNF complex component SNF12 homolog isoform X2 [Malania oleifera]|uniref:SWI/SNF complex component SNF12 homolog isoform X2 n=1 Tax=Malania oleifera TaxID=397392 RepID=UPI0025ADD7A3|nr:SWI/SNF complex component SNF12 homolog isoform X2 [Malania oleifera]
MANTNNNSMKNVGAPTQTQTPFGGNAGINHQSHLLSQTQSQTHGGSIFSGHFQLSEPQAQAVAQAQYAQAHAQAQAQAAHAQFQAQLQAQAQVHPSRVQNPGSGSISASSLSVSVPVTGGVKRAQPKPPSRPPGSAASNTGLPFKTMELTPAARRKKQKLPDKQIPDKVAALVPESALYTHLLELEARIDAALARKKSDIQESLRDPPTVQKTLRIYVFNTFINHLGSNPENENAEPPSWVLKLTGRILENVVEPDPDGVLHKPNSWYPKFSSFFKRITIYLDQSLYPNNHVILWEKARSSALHEGFEVKRKGDKEFTAMVRLEMNYMPEKLKLSPVLVDVLGIDVDTRPRIIAALWHYVKVKKLQDPSDPSIFVCDPPLRKVFGEEKMKFAVVSQKISQHLSPPPPIHLVHKIKLSGNCPAGTTCYDVLVDVPFQLEKEMSAFLANTGRHAEIDAYDDTITASIKKIHEHCRRRAFFLGFSQSPVEFINALIASQSRDLKLAAGDASRNSEKEHRSDFYNQSWFEDAVVHYLNRKTAAGSDAIGSTAI